MNLQSGTNPVTNAIEIRDLSVSYTAVVERPLEERSKLFTKSTKKTEIRALDKVNANIQQGKVTGIIGGNGAGKSTLLKTIVGVLKPSNGRIDLWGRPHLLKPGMGFNPTLSGRDNVILGGLAAGMSMDEVKDKQDEIIEFADIGGFIDLPANTYSSGMYGRLAFAVATHVDPEILLIDEALSAGDAAFKDRAKARVKNLVEDTATILLVSHSTTLVSEMATEAIWLHQGTVRKVGKAEDVSEEYHRSLKKETETAQMDRGIADR